MTVRARFAPSPTGYLHLGGARTALFSWAWARQNGGEFFLRIEDTDAARSREEFVSPILSALQWLGLRWDGEVVFQSERRAEHLQAAERLLESGLAYRCYCSPEELAQMRAEQVARGENPGYNRKWRDAKESPPPNVPPAIRFKTPTDGGKDVRFSDLVKKSEMTTTCNVLDDFVIVRADGTPTYNFACAADDDAMGITHVIRGDDHAMNTFKQILVRAALRDGEPVFADGPLRAESPDFPRFAHLPMILNAARDDGGNIVRNPDGETKYERMSKRNGAVDVLHYRREGFLPAALLNYLARLSWSHGDDEKFGTDEFVRNFNFAHVQESPARFDLDKLRWLNREHMRDLSPQQLREAGRDASAAGGEGREGRDDESFWDKVPEPALALALPRASTLRELRAEAECFVERPVPDPELLRAHVDDDNREAMARLTDALEKLPEWSADAIKSTIKDSAKAAGLKFAKLGMPARVLLTGASESADIAQVAAALGKDETVARLRALKEL